MAFLTITLTIFLNPSPNMKIILAEINGTPELAVRHAIKLKKTCEELGLEHPINVNSAEELIDILGEHKGQDILLFSNFPPDSSYPTSGKSMKHVDMGDYIARSWEADYYSISKKLFTALEKTYTLKALHFITGASSLRLKDEDITSMFPGTPLTITRKKDWIYSEIDYQLHYRKHVEKKIKETLT